MPIFGSESGPGGSLPDSPSDGRRIGLDSPAVNRAIGEFDDILARVRKLETAPPPLLSRAPIVDALYAQGASALDALLPAMTATALPIPGKTRQSVRTMQDALRTLAILLLDLHDEFAERNADGSASAPLLWKALRALSRHLLISSLTASPPGADIWKLLHQTYNRARQDGVTRDIPAGTPRSLQDEYYAAVLLGCAQPTSFSGVEVSFLDDYLERFADQIDSNRDKAEDSAVMFWIDPTRNVPATPYNRKPPPPETPVRYFSCSRLAALLSQQLAAIESGTPPAQLDLPPFAATPAGRGVLSRLIGLWGKPGKRRFPRRRQNYRSELTFGFDNLWRLFMPPPERVETSAWMITNESPDGYSAMHVSGKIGAIAVGDVAALRTETGETWQLCIIRWGLSENQEHIELGLQILSARAYSARLALPTGTQTSACHPALVLPATPALRQDEALVVPSGVLAGQSKDLVLIIEQDNICVREISTARRDEQNGLIELYGLEPRPSQE